jgi:arginase
MKHHIWIILPLLAAPAAASGQRYLGDGIMRVAVVKMPYSGARNVSELSDVPDYLEQGGVLEVITQTGAATKPVRTVRLTPGEEEEYGEWHRLGLANGRLAGIVTENEKSGHLTVGLLANCSSLMGMLAGLQHSGPGRRPLKVGLVWIDAHGDFNTPETTLSGMLGGMPVAVSAGLALQNLRLKSGLDPALPTRYITMAAVRDLDPLEQELIDRSDVEMLTVHDVRIASDNLHHQMQRLSRLTDLIYVHVDMDVLDPSEVAGHSLTVPGGPTSEELATALTEMFRYEKVAALGIASTPSWERDPEGLSRRAAYALIQGALEGAKARHAPPGSP